MVTTLALMVGVIMLLAVMAPSEPRKPAPTFSDFLAQLERGDVDAATLRVRDNSLQVRPRHGPVYETAYEPELADELIGRLMASGADVDIEPAVDAGGAPLPRCCCPWRSSSDSGFC